MALDESAVTELTACVNGGVASAPGQFLVWYRPRLRMMVRLRTIAGNQLLAACRRHCRTQGRDARREISPRLGALAHFVACSTSPGGAAVRAELKDTIERALSELDAVDFGGELWK